MAYNATVRTPIFRQVRLNVVYYPDERRGATITNDIDVFIDFDESNSIYFLIRKKKTNRPYWLSRKPVFFLFIFSHERLSNVIVASFLLRHIVFRPFTSYVAIVELIAICKRGKSAIRFFQNRLVDEVIV